jgi:ketosteroid isomerase-like protein
MKTRRICLLALVGAVASTAVPTGAAATPGVTDPALLDRVFITAYNAARFDDLPALFTDDAVYVPPNHEPIKGAAAVVEFYRQLRPVLGAVAPSEEVHKVVRAEGTYAQTISYAFTSGVRANDTEVMVRGADGAWRYALCEAGLRDPLQ